MLEKAKVLIEEHVSRTPPLDGTTNNAMQWLRLTAMAASVVAHFGALIGIGTEVTEIEM